MSQVKLRKITYGHYKTTVNGYEFEIHGPDPYYKPSPGYEWSVESWSLGIEEHYSTLRKVRRYLNSIKEDLERRTYV